MKKTLITIFLFWVSLAFGADTQVHHGESFFPTNTKTVTLTNGVHYSLDAGATISNAFPRLINTRNTGGGDDTNSVNLDRTMVNVQDGDIASSFTLERDNALQTTYASWEIIEYVGPKGGPNEFIVRGAGLFTNGASGPLGGTSAVTFVEDDSDVVVFISGLFSTRGNPTPVDTTLYKSEWDSTNDAANFFRGQNARQTELSFAIVEFVGDNWRIQYDTNILNATDIVTNTIATAVNTGKTFLVVDNLLDDAGAQDEHGTMAYFASSNQIVYERRSTASDQQQTSCWIVENLDTTANGMSVTHYLFNTNDVATGITNTPSRLTNIITSVSSTNNASIMSECSVNHHEVGGIWPIGSVNLRLLSTNEVEIRRVSDEHGDTVRYSVVDWGDSPNTGRPVDVPVQTNFNIIRGENTITSGVTTVSITNGVHYTLAASSTVSNSFIQIVNTHLSGAGPTDGSPGVNSDRWMVYISNPSNLTNSITFEKDNATGESVVTWELFEYIGPPNGPHEIIVRDTGLINTTNGISKGTGTVTTVTDDNDVVVLITGQRSRESSQSPSTGMYTSEWDSGNDYPIFTRISTNGNGDLSYAVVEYTGIDWFVQTATNWLTGSTDSNTVAITGLDTNTAFMHVQFRVSVNEDDEQGSLVWFSATNQVSFERESTALGDMGVTAWLVSNPGLTTRHYHTSLTGTATGGTNDLRVLPVQDIGDSFNTSVMGECAVIAQTGTFAPDGAMNLRLIQRNGIEVRHVDNFDDRRLRYSTVGWPLTVFELPRKVPKAHHLPLTPNTPR
ncbi:MAG: hypothetical protein KAS32_29315 [Candidatus Peribacteraceae bacterium]|nr:hypothetical protein [Candidatus Peribacteraceae bacterium]